MTPHPSAAEAFVLRLARGLHGVGYPAHRLEDALSAVSRRLGLDGQFFSTPTGLFAAFGNQNAQRTFQLRGEPGATNLSRLARLDETARLVAEGQLSPEAGTERLEAVERAPRKYNRLLTTLCFALTSAGSARFFGGGPREVLAAAAIGLGTGLLALGVERWPSLGRVFEAVAAALAAFLATCAERWAGPVSGYVAMVAGLIVLLPGFSLTVALTELATRHLVSGTARLTGALGTFLALGFGVAFGLRVGTLWTGVVVDLRAGVPTHALAAWTLYLALALAPLTLAVLLRADLRDTPQIIVTCVLAFFAARLGVHALGPELGPFLGAFVVGLCGNVYSRLWHRPASIPIVPGLLLLVPGSLGFASVSSLLESETVSGVATAFRTTFGAVSLVVGLLCASVLFPARPLAQSRASEATR